MRRMGWLGKELMGAERTKCPVWESEPTAE